MPTTLVQFLAAFIPIKKYRKQFRNKFMSPKTGHCRQHIEGQGNVIHCPNGFKLNYSIVGDNNTVYIDDSDCSFNTQVDVYIGTPQAPAYNCTLKIGKNFSSNGTMIFICEDNTEVTIGQDCMFSGDIDIWASDTHTLTDMSGKCINVGKFVHIGDHVWLGYGATVLKNSIIPNNCIVGGKSVVSGRFDSPHCVIAGNPAKICKQNINWNRQRPQAYLNKQGVQKHD